MKKFKKSFAILLTALLIGITPASIVQASSAGCNCKEAPAKIYVTSYTEYGRDVDSYFYDANGNKVNIYKDYHRTVLVWRYQCPCCGASSMYNEKLTKQYN